jgi:hypothetical protein
MLAEHCAGSGTFHRHVSLGRWTCQLGGAHLALQRDQLAEHKIMMIADGSRSVVRQAVITTAFLLKSGAVNRPPAVRTRDIC